VELKKETLIRKRTVVKLDEVDVCTALRKLIPGMPANAEITVTIPSGGDYSGDDLRLEDSGGLTVSWEESYTE